MVLNLYVTFKFFVEHVASSPTSVTKTYMLQSLINHFRIYNQTILYVHFHSYFKKLATQKQNNCKNKFLFNIMFYMKTSKYSI